MQTVIIAAVASDGSIGKNGQLAFHISEDLKRFKALTMGHTVIMGRKTFESLPKGALPNRRNIVITRNPEASFPGAETARSVEEALAMARTAGETEAFIIGGAQIYAQTLPLADRLEITAIEATLPDADAFFPKIEASLWELRENTGPMTDAKTGIPYRFQTFRSIR